MKLYRKLEAWVIRNPVLAGAIVGDIAAIAKDAQARHLSWETAVLAAFIAAQGVIVRSKVTPVVQAWPPPPVDSTNPAGPPARPKKEGA